MTNTTPRPPTIGYITPAIHSSYFRLLLAGVQRAARERGARLIVFQMAARDVAANELAARRVDGWVACFSDAHTEGLDTLAQSGKPFVMVSLPIANTPVVVTDNTSGMYDVTRHLWHMGRRRIAFVGWHGNPDIPHRLTGYRKALAESGAPDDPALVYLLDGGTQADGATFARQLLETERSCDAIAFCSDNLALGAMRIFREAGIRIPEDLAITGFDDVPEAQIAQPPLTTVRMRFDTMSRAATEHLLDMIAGRPRAMEPIVIPMHLVIRRSAGGQTEQSAEPEREPAIGRAMLARRLAEIIGAPQTLMPDEPPTRLWPEVETIVAAVETTLRGVDPPDDSALQSAWASAISISAYADPLEAAILLIESVLEEEYAGLPIAAVQRRNARQLLQRLRTMVLRAAIGGQINRIGRSEQALSQIDAVARVLATCDLEMTLRLDWLTRTEFTAAALGIWESGVTRPALRIAGRYPAADAPVDQHITAAEFPPLNDNANAPAPTMVLSLRSEQRDWGFLALQFASDLESAAVDSTPLLAALLTAQINTTSLQHERETQAADMRIAYERERALAATVRELGCPVIPLNRRVLLVPLIGAIDSQRAEHITSTLLTASRNYRARAILLDVTGVSLIDTHIAGLLLELTGMIRLLGSRTILVGVRPEIAQSIIGLGIDLRQIASYASLTDALAALRTNAPE